MPRGHSPAWQYHGFTDPGPEHLLPRASQTRILPPPGFEPFEFFQVTFMKFTPSSTEPHVRTDRFKGKPRPPVWQGSSARWGLKNKKRNPSFFSSQDTWLNAARFAAVPPNLVILSSMVCFGSLFSSSRLLLGQPRPAPLVHLAIHSHSRQVLKLPLLGEKTPVV